MMILSKQSDPWMIEFSYVCLNVELRKENNTGMDVLGDTYCHFANTEISPLPELHLGSKLIDSRQIMNRALTDLCRNLWINHKEPYSPW